MAKPTPDEIAAAYREFDAADKAHADAVAAAKNAIGRTYEERLALDIAKDDAVARSIRAVAAVAELVQRAKEKQ